MGLVNEIRADLGVPDMPLMVGDWNEGGAGSTRPTATTADRRPQLRMIPERDPRTGAHPHRRPAACRTIGT